MAQTENEKAVKNYKDLVYPYTTAERVKIEMDYNRAKAEGEPG